MADKISANAYAKDCPVCGITAGTPCPHTPVRCAHKFWHGEINGPGGPWRAAPGTTQEGDLRTCEECGYQERAQITWQVARAGYDA